MHKFSSLNAYYLRCARIFFVNATLVFDVLSWRCLLTPLVSVVGYRAEAARSVVKQSDNHCVVCIL